MQKSNNVTINADPNDQVNIKADIEPFAGDVAREYAKQAKASAENAASSESASAASESAAKASETAAASSASAAASSAASAKESENAAASSATAAKNSETAAAASAKDAHDVAAAIGNPVTDVTEVNGKVTVTKSNGDKNEFFAGLNMLQRNKSYAVGDIAYSASLPSWAYLECTTAGTTGKTEPDFSGVTTGGGTITDGTAKWKVIDIKQDKRDANALEEKLTSETNARQEGDDALRETMKAYLPISWDQAEITSLISDSQGSRDLQLNQSYRNFDAILFITANDDYQDWVPAFWPVCLFDWMMSYAKEQGKRINIGPRYSWVINPAQSTDTLLKTTEESSAIIAIFGINFTK